MPRRPKLVTQFLERIHRSAFDKHPVIIRSLVQRRNGIYALYNEKQIRARIAGVLDRIADAKESWASATVA